MLTSTGHGMHVGSCKRSKRCKATKQGRKVQPRNLVVRTLDSEEKKSDRFIADSNVSSHYPFYKKPPFKMKLWVPGIGHWNSGVLVLIKMSDSSGIYGRFMPDSWEFHTFLQGCSTTKNKQNKSKSDSKNMQVFQSSGVTVAVDLQ